MTFGQYIAESRKKAGLSQKNLAERLRKEDGQSISAQYLNDIEHDRRNPPGEFILIQISSELNISLDYLRFLSGTLPDDIKLQNHQPEDVENAFKAFRKALKGDDKYEYACDNCGKEFTSSLESLFGTELLCEECFDAYCLAEELNSWEGVEDG